MSNFATVQRFTVGASPSTCKMGGANYEFDSRPYATALKQEGYPQIDRWIEGDLEEPELWAECLHCLRTAISNGSFPMLAVCCLALADSKAKAKMIGELTGKESARLQSLIKIGSALDETIGKIIKGWSNDTKQPKQTKQGSAGELLSRAS